MGRPTIREAIGNSVWLVCDQLLRMALGLVVGVWVARYLGPGQFGALNYALAIIGVAGSFTSLGVNSIVVRELAKIPASKNTLLGTTLALRAGAATVALAACVFFSHWRQAQAQVLVTVVATGMVFQASDVFDLLFQARGQARISAWVRMASCFLVNALRVVLILRSAPLLAFAWMGVLEIVLNGAGWIFAALLSGEQLKRWGWRKAEAAIILTQSWPLAIAGVSLYAQAYSDQIVIGHYLGSARLGEYAAALRLVSVFSFVPTIVQLVAAPEIARAHRDNLTLYRKRLYSTYRLMFGLFVVMALPLVTIGPALIRALYGADYAGTAGLVPWLALRLFFTNFGVARSIFLTNESLFRFSLVTAIAGATVNIGLNIIVVPKWGAVGAVFVSFVSFFVTTFGLEIFQPTARANLFQMIRAISQPWRPYSAPL